MLFNDSDAQRKEYTKIGLPFEETEEDKHHKFILKQIENDTTKKETISAMTRIAIGPNEEYIVYNHKWEGINPIGSHVSTTQTNVGIYGRFEPIYERFIQEDNTYGQRLISKNTVVSYSIPFNKENAEQLHKLCNDVTQRAGLRTRYYAMPEGGTKITVNSYQDWLNGDIEDLLNTGKAKIKATSK